MLNTIYRRLGGLLLGVSLALGAQAQNVTVNPGAGTYPTLKAAFDAINAGTHTGALTISVVADTTETVSAVLNASGTGAASYTSINLTPSGARTISGAIVAGSPLIDLNGADNVTINGLNAAGNSLVISNTTASATSGTSTIRLQTDASGNTITNADIRGSASMAASTNGGNIWIAAGAVTTGNDNNTISNNNIGPAGSNLPTKAVYFTGTSNTLANNGNVVTGNNIFDYFGAAVASTGVFVASSGTTDLTVSNNRFFQTATRTQTTGAQHSAIQITNAGSALGYTITGNTIGFASAAGTGSYGFVGVASSSFIPIFLNVGTTVATSVQGNTITAITQSGASSGTGSSAPFRGIYVAGGLVSVGDVSGNTIGSQSATGAIAYTSNATSASEVIAIFNFGSSNFVTSNNLIGGITANNSSTGAANVYGLRCNTGSAVTWTAVNNIVGGSVANSMQSTSTSTGTVVQGILNSNPIANFTGNIVRNLSASAGTGTTTPSVVGILISAGAANHTLAQNTIFNLNNSNATAATVVTGIQFTGSTSNVVERNLIYGLTTATTSVSAEVNGIRVSGGTTIYRNNMIALGAGISNAIGAAASNSSTLGVVGINEFLGTNSFFHNSVYIGGTAGAGVGSSFAFNGTQTTNTRSFRDNIFFNARTNGAATGKHYAVKINGTTANPAGLTINNNLYFANGTGAVFGFFNSLDVANLTAWRIAVGQDTASIEGNPQYLDPTNAVPDLHLSAVTPTAAEGNGADVGVTNDFDGQTRATLTPVDIGADAGNFVSAGDIVPPNITYTALANTTLTTNRTLNVTITDATGVATGGIAPRIYFRKNAGVYFSQACSLSAGSVTNGTWSCVVNNADLGGVMSADVVNYFVIAQDTLGNVASNASGAVASSVNTVTTPPAAPNAYGIVAGFTGVINVGAAQTFTSLTNAGGIFEAINAGAVTGNITLNITSDLAGELGTNALNQFTEDGVGGYTMLIRPSGAPRTITGSNTGALIRLNGADRVTIDGSATGATATGVGGNAALRELTIQNTNVGTAAVVIAVQSGTAGAQNNTLRNLNVLGQDPTTTLLGISFGGTSPGTVGADNDGNRAENCSVKRAIFGIYSAGQSVANPNTGTVITRNDLSATGTDRLRRIGIAVFNDNGVLITENSVGGLDTNESADGVAIGVGTFVLDQTLTASGGITNALVARNRINGVLSSNTTGFSAAGIAIAGAPGGSNTIANNMISGITAPATSPDLVAGIFVAGVTGASTRVLFNSVSLTGDRGAVAAQSPGFGIAVTGVDPTVEIKNNVFSTTQIASGGGVDARSYSIGLVSTTFVNLDSNRNDFFSSGANAGFFRSGSLAGAAGTNYATLAAWQTAVADDANSIELDPLFVSATDLHLQATSPAINAASPIAGVTDDIDGETRSLVTPEIGADEIVPPNTAPTITPAVGISRQQGTAFSNSTIATVGDAEQVVGTLVVTAPSVPAGLTVNNIVNTTGTATADIVAGCTATLGANAVGLSVSDGLLSTAGSLSVNVTANSAPVLGVYPAGSATTGLGSTVTPGAAPSDNGAVATLTASAPGFTGSFSGNPTTGVITVSNAGPAAVYTVTVTATDNCGSTSTATFSLTVTNANTAPTITPAVGVTRQAGSATSNSTIATVSDAEQAVGTLVVTAPTVPAGLTVNNIVNTTGTATADIVAACTVTLGANAVGLSVSDGTLSTTGNLSVNVTANSAPILGVYPAGNATTGLGSTVTPGAAPTDNGAVATLTASAPGFTGSFIGNPATGVITVSNAGPAGSYTVTVTATDNCSSTSTATFILNVSNANTAPTITPAVGVTRQQGTAASISTIASVNDAELAAGSLLVTAPTVPAGLTVSGISNSTGTVAASVAAACSATLGANAVVLNVSDGSLNTNGNLSIDVTANSAPVLGTYAATMVSSGGSVSITPTAAPTDNGSVLTLIASAPGFTGTLTGNPSTGVISVSGAAPPSSTAYVVTITATDNCGLTSTRTFNLTVANSADLEVSKTDGVSSYSPGDLLVYTIVLRNLGPDAANGVTLTDTIPASLFNASWTCVSANGASCPQAGGVGNVNVTIAALPATASVTYTLQANVTTPTPAQVVNTAQVSIGSLPIQDPNLNNNSATDTNFAGTIFSNGFEDAAIINRANGFEVLPLTLLQGLIDGTARALLSLDDSEGEALRVYGRRSSANELELALAVRNANGNLQLGEWRKFAAVDVKLSYTASLRAKGFVVQTARLD
jgi:trimeric autotransporter adhesin